MYAETFGCMYAPFGCMYAETVGCMYAEVGCKSMESFGCMSMPFTRSLTVNTRVK